MSYVMGQITVPNASTVTLFAVPPGLCNVTFWNTSAANIYIGTSTAVTTSNGLVCHSIPTNFFSYVSGRGATLYGANTAGTSAVLNYIMVTDQ